MLQQELRQRDEDLAARRAEIGELKERVAELEKMRQQQQELLALKDSELATVQQRLEDARKASAGAPAAPPAAGATLQPAAAGTTQASAPPSSAEQAGNAAPWLWGGLAVLGMALLAWLFTRRRRTPATPPRRAFDSDALAASLRPVHAGNAEPGTEPLGPLDPSVADATASPLRAVPSDRDVHPVPEREAPPEHAVQAPDPEPGAPTRSETPAWHSGRRAAGVPQAPVATPAEPRFVPVVDNGRPASAVPGPGSDHRLKLARAFQDIGDDDSARELLRELLDSADPAAREEAARVLRELG